jgi:hypothetical protein
VHIDRNCYSWALKMQQFKINGYDAIMLNGIMQIAVPNLEEAFVIISKFTKAIRSKKITTLQVSFPYKVFLIDSPSPDDLRIRIVSMN